VLARIRGLEGMRLLHTLSFYRSVSPGWWIVVQMISLPASNVFRVPRCSRVLDLWLLFAASTGWTAKRRALINTMSRCVLALVQHNLDAKSFRRCYSVIVHRVYRRRIVCSLEIFAAKEGKRRQWKDESTWHRRALRISTRQLHRPTSSTWIRIDTEQKHLPRPTVNNTPRKLQL